MKFCSLWDSCISLDRVLLLMNPDILELTKSVKILKRALACLYFKVTDDSVGSRQNLPTEAGRLNKESIRFYAVQLFVVLAFIIFNLVKLVSLILVFW